MFTKILTNLDLFGITPKFSINEKEAYKSAVGGVLTFFCGILLVVCFIFFGDDFYNKKNPKIIESQMFNDDYYTRNLTTNQGIIAWKIEDHYTIMPNFTDVLYPKIIYSSFVMNKTTNNLDFIYEKILPNKKCSDVADLDPFFRVNNDPNQWYCMDFTGVNFPFGGYWGDKIINMIYLVLDSCNPDKSKCSTLNEIKKLAPGAKNNLFFSMLYPKHYFSPQNISSPLNYEYYYFTETIDLNVIKKNVFFFKDVEIDDDLGGIFPEVRNYKIFAFDSFFKDYFYKPEEEYQNVNPEMNTFIYMNSLYFNKNPYYYKRSFMKLQDLAAVVGGVLKTVMVAFSIFAQIYNSMSMKKYLIEKFFVRVTKDKNEDLTHLRFTSEFLANNNFKSEANLIFKEEKNPIESLNNSPFLVNPTPDNIYTSKEKNSGPVKEINDFYAKTAYNRNSTKNTIDKRSENNFNSKKSKNNSNEKINDSKKVLNNNYCRESKFTSNAKGKFTKDSPVLIEIINKKKEYLNNHKEFRISKILFSSFCNAKNKGFKKFLLAQKFMDKNSSYESFTKNVILLQKLQDVILNERQNSAFSIIEPFNLEDYNDVTKINNFLKTDAKYDTEKLKHALVEYSESGFDKKCYDEKDYKIIKLSNMEKYFV